MKAIFRSLSLAAMLALGTQAQAQLPAGSLAPNFTFTDINGTSHTLYDILATGKTVFIDVSAAWCGPCWNYHNTGALEDLYINHGPMGAPNVSATTTNDVMVLFIEGEQDNTAAQLTGTSGAGVLSSQGDWVAGTPYPIIDLPTDATGNSFMSGYAIGYFPTIYKICPNRIIEEPGQQSAANLYAMVAPCPGPATQAVDATILNYLGDSYACGNQMDVSLTFQNHGTAALTGATVTLTDGLGATIATQPVAGSVASYDVATVNFGTVTVPAGTTSVVATINAAGDAVPTDNTLTQALGSIMNAPYDNNFDATLNADYVIEDVGNDGVSWGQVGIGAGGSAASVFMFFYNSPDLQVDNFYIPKTSMVSSTASIARVTWNRAAAQYTDANTPLTNDKVEFQVSTDCGATWNTLWEKVGADLATRAGTSSNYGGTTVPVAAADWIGDTVMLTQYLGEAEMLMRFKATSNYGNNAFFDNVNIELLNGVAIEDAKNVTDFKVYPNPTVNVANVSFNLVDASDVTVEVFNSNGQSVYTAAQGKMGVGTQSVSINTTEFAAGVYMVNVRSNGQSISQLLNVAK